MEFPEINGKCAAGCASQLAGHIIKCLAIAHCNDCCGLVQTLRNTSLSKQLRVKTQRHRRILSVGD